TKRNLGSINSGAATGMTTASFSRARTLSTKKFYFARADLNLGRAVPIRFPKKSRRNIVRQTSRDGAPAQRLRYSTRVRLRPPADWHKRNFLTSVLIPSLFIKRSGSRMAPQFPKIREGEICITWTGDASFLIQTHVVNI